MRSRLSAMLSARQIFGTFLPPENTIIWETFCRSNGSHHRARGYAQTRSSALPRAQLAELPHITNSWSELSSDPPLVSTLFTRILHIRVRFIRCLLLPLDSRLALLVTR